MQLYKVSVTLNGPVPLVVNHIVKKIAQNEAGCFVLVEDETTSHFYPATSVRGIRCQMVAAD